MIIAIDPGTTLSAYVMLSNNFIPIEFGKIPNEELLDILYKYTFVENDHLVIEMISCYGANVGETIFETVFWIGRFYEACDCKNKIRIKRKEVKMNLCHSMRAKDGDIRKALISRFAKHDFKNGKGTINNKDWFFGFKADIWQSYALGVTFFDTSMKSNKIDS